jgi:hypothetical protein
MDILIQNEKTNLFLTAKGRWTARRGSALLFSKSESALRFCLENRLSTVLLFFSYSNPALDFTIAPFSGAPPNETTYRSSIQNSAYLQARSLALQNENRQLRKELDSIIAEGKERRKRRRFPRSKGT